MALIDELRHAIGAAQVLTEGDLSAWEIDWRRRYCGRARAVVRPADTLQVAAVVQACARHGASIVTQGGNTSLVGGSVPDASGTQVVLSLKRMMRIRELDASNLTMTVDAGCVLKQVQEAAAVQGLLYPLSLAAEGSCTVGGTLATNAGGTQVLRYGNARELCLGLEVVTASGDIWNGLSGLRKDNTGYDLRDLYIGSEGTLGVITAATLKLYPQPAAVTTAMAAAFTLPDALRLLDMARNRLGAGLTGFEVMNETSLGLVRTHFPEWSRPLPPGPWTVLLEQSDTESEVHARVRFESLLEAAMSDGCITDAAVAGNLEQAAAMWRLREGIPLAQTEEGLNIKHDIAVPVSRIPAFVQNTDAALRASWPGVRIVNFGHLGDGNLHYNVQAPAGVSAADFLQTHEAKVNALVYDAVVAHGGSISAEHGIGALKREALAAYKSPVALQLMRAIKRALDPVGTMNPGRML
ncbi:MAG: FAD-binding oxidoreductase [Burkholderiaceae bacterium]|nr:FAD-binding oxidoreductase [Burkholderiaceae bacterium]